MLLRVVLPPARVVPTAEFGRTAILSECSEHLSSRPIARFSETVLRSQPKERRRDAERPQGGELVAGIWLCRRAVLPAV